MCLFLKHKYIKVKHVSVSCFYSVFQTLDMTESHGSNFRICKLANFPKVDFCRIIVGAIWDPCNELKKQNQLTAWQLLLLLQMSGFTHDRVIFYWPTMDGRARVYNTEPLHRSET